MYICTYEGDTDSSAKEQNIRDEMYMYQNNAEDSQSGGLAWPYSVSLTVYYCGPPSPDLDEWWECACPFASAIYQGYVYTCTYNGIKSCWGSSHRVWQWHPGTHICNYYLNMLNKQFTQIFHWCTKFKGPRRLGWNDSHSHLHCVEYLCFKTIQILFPHHLPQRIHGRLYSQLTGEA